MPCYFRLLNLIIILFKNISRNLKEDNKFQRSLTRTVKNRFYPPYQYKLVKDLSQINFPIGSVACILDRGLHHLSATSIFVL